MAVNSTPAIGASDGSVNTLVPASQVRFSPVNPDQPNRVKAYLPWTDVVGHKVLYGLAVADLLAMRVVENISLTSEPTDTVVAHDGAFIYTVASDNLFVTQTDTYEVSAVPVLVPEGAIAASPTETFTMKLLTGVALTADDSQLLIAGQQQPPDIEENAYLAVFDIATSTVQSALTLTSTTDFQAHHLVLTSDGDYAITNLQAQRIDIVDLKHFTIVKSVLFIPDSVIAMAVDPTNTYVYAAVGPLGGASGSVKVVEIATGQVKATFTLSSAPHQIEVSADGQNLFLTVGSPTPTGEPVVPPKLVVLDATDGVETTLLSEAGPFAIDSVGQRLFVFDTGTQALNIFEFDT